MQVYIDEMVTYRNVDDIMIYHCTIWYDDLSLILWCANKLKSLGVTSVLDIACGCGEFVRICNEKYKLNAYGINPYIGDGPNLYYGTFESVLSNQKLLKNNLKQY